MFYSCLMKIKYQKTWGTRGGKTAADLRLLNYQEIHIVNDRNATIIKKQRVYQRCLVNNSAILIMVSLDLTMWSIEMNSYLP